MAVSGVADLHFGATVDAYQQVPRFRFSAGRRIDNMTDWSLGQSARIMLGTKKLQNAR
jgi:hypothetical protein